jgi:DNA-binding GntR family transcriptional regulator
MSDAQELSQDLPQGQGVYQRIMDEIRAGLLMPGARLREVELADRFGISRTPVREALRLLESEGLVVHLPRQGASLRRLDHAEVVELYEMRAVLEGTAARLASRTATDVEISEIGALNSDLAAAPAAEQAQALNRQFHRTLLNAARNRFLIRAMRGLQRTLLILGPTTLASPDRAIDAVAEHDAVLRAMQARDGAGAEAAMRLHVEAALAARLRGMRMIDPPPIEEEP